MRLTLRHLWHARQRRSFTDIRKDNFYEQNEGLVTIQYPLETIPIPDNGRYRLHNEMDDCIVCDKCVKVCPVDCIEIEPIKAIEEVGRASDGSPIRLYAAKFDIDMAKCCYCGLCTTVCPTECLTMTKTFDYSEFDVRDMVYNYANLSAEEADEKRRLLEQFQKEKEALKAASKPVTASEPTPAAPRPVFKPSIKPKVQEAETEVPADDAKPARPSFQPRKPVIPPVADKSDESATEKPAVKLPFKPSMKPKTAETDGKTIDVSPETTEGVSPKPAFRPTMKPRVPGNTNETKPEANTETVPEQEKPKPAFRPTMKPKAPDNTNETKPEANTETVPEQEKPKPAFRPTMKPRVPDNTNEIKPQAKAETEAEPVKPKPAFRPTMKPKVPDNTNETKPQAKAETEVEPVKPKPAFRPTMKPKPKSPDDE
ncbi:NAD(P)H-quinone oxidoreductase subunit I, chloroplastic [Dyadobacter sp. CECT 9275]|uniref:NAD(P)H-quinone oxidoreductase subunit I, chloroplastic n=2 Tax=Dyadobacter helix TaxID=2822344 RepID=A0A916JFC5_9BACT|nr:NAD(P)H-quinone oxidoreductase subunit I, chloroplastic [Dyadobacter sp. CECT 9275]